MGTGRGCRGLAPCPCGEAPPGAEGGSPDDRDRHHHGTRSRGDRDSEAPRHHSPVNAAFRPSTASGMQPDYLGLHTIVGAGRLYRRDFPVK